MAKTPQGRGGKVDHGLYIHLLQIWGLFLTCDTYEIYAICAIYQDNQEFSIIYLELSTIHQDNPNLRRPTSSHI